MSLHLIQRPLERIAEDDSWLALDMWRNVSDPEILLPYFVAEIGICTAGQAVRYLRRVREIGEVLPRFTHEEVHDTLARLVEERGWLGCLKNVVLPEDCGRTVTDVYYLTKQGLRMLAKETTESTRFFRSGRPRGVVRRRVAHDLLVTEAYLHVLRATPIKMFLGENKIKSIIARARYEADMIIDGELPSESTGDFMVYVEAPNGSGCHRWIECEVVRRLDRDAIKRKPDDMAWFVCDAKKRDTVAAVKGMKARIVELKNVCEPCHHERCERGVRLDPATGEPVGSEPEVPAKPRQTSRAQLTSRQRSVLEVLDNLVATTDDAIAHLLRIDASGVRKRLIELRRLGYVAIDKAHLNPGQSRGRWQQLYRVAHLPAMRSATKIHHLMVSVAVVKFGELGFSDARYDAESGTVKLICKTQRNVLPHTVIVDDTAQSVDEINKRYFALKPTNGVGIGLDLFMMDAQRVKELRALNPQVRIVNLCASRSLGEPVANGM